MTEQELNKKISKLNKYTERRCRGYCGATCVDGRCTIALSCKDCFCYNGCEDCCLNGTDLCDCSIEKGSEQK